jgi:hypothetical protein
VHGTDSYIHRPLSVSETVDTAVDEIERLLQNIGSVSDPNCHLTSAGLNTPSSPPALFVRDWEPMAHLAAVLFPVERGLILQILTWMPCAIQSAGTSTGSARFVVARGLPKSFVASLISVVTSPHVLWLLAAGGARQTFDTFAHETAREAHRTCEAYLRKIDLWELPPHNTAVSNVTRQIVDRYFEQLSTSTAAAAAAAVPSPAVCMSPIMREGNGNSVTVHGEVAAVDMPIGEYQRQQALLMSFSSPLSTMTDVRGGQVGRESPCECSASAAPPCSLSVAEQVTLQTYLSCAMLSTRCEQSVQLCRSMLSAGLKTLRRAVSITSEDRGGFDDSPSTQSAEGPEMPHQGIGKTIDRILHDMSLEDLARSCALVAHVEAPLMCRPQRRLAVVLVRRLDFRDGAEAMLWFGSGLTPKDQASSVAGSITTPALDKNSRLLRLTPAAEEAMAPSMSSSTPRGLPRPAAAADDHLQALTELSPLGRREIEKVLGTLFRLVIAGCAVENVRHLVLTPLMSRSQSPFTACLSEKAVSALGSIYYRTLFIELERAAVGSQLQAVYLFGEEFHPWAQHELATSGRVWNFHDIAVVLHRHADPLEIVRALGHHHPTIERVGLVCPADSMTILTRSIHSCPLEQFSLLEQLAGISSLASELGSLHFSPMRLSGICDAADFPLLGAGTTGEKPKMWCPVDLIPCASV